ncbi:hypothetical protein COCSUDRAFT_60370 [Coccomyxa subellipsoidea C-169]|uniref:Uncharacterized protein n=1 Tax=Coccomyxa subellipsoidea (strain C-169) TaxID=574566 RepID=I0YJ37_COCSC|nr:hypothetical protein COCSUDRAFT_60370 [Coccomyxa subellipsoidea C-169]EIE18406.1 hypothetical protein COCSUDRAFT_60370 [Coccomyxa subellipsoidea C-169]|eukprot:XP_005642950.1 hypothetical protein COCSUDRAFT_60370 [Coccomyxa subellipsoidea C-169]
MVTGQSVTLNLVGNGQTVDIGEALLNTGTINTQLCAGVSYSLQGDYSLNGTKVFTITFAGGTDIATGAYPSCAGKTLIQGELIGSQPPNNLSVEVIDCSSTPPVTGAPTPPATPPPAKQDLLSILAAAKKRIDKAVHDAIVSQLRSVVG